MGDKTIRNPGADIHHISIELRRGVGGIGQEQGSTDSGSSPSNLAQPIAFAKGYAGRTWQHPL